MQERSLFMGVTELPLIKDTDHDFDFCLPIEFSASVSNKSSPSNKRKLKKIGTYYHSNDLSSNLPRNLIYQFPNSMKKNVSVDHRNDTRIVNEAFQVNMKHLFKAKL
jgi:hypothetical protein